MSRRPALVTQAEVARAIRAAKREGASAVEVKCDGSLLIHLLPQSPLSTPDAVDADAEIVL